MRFLKSNGTLMWFGKIETDVYKEWDLESNYTVHFVQQNSNIMRKIITSVISKPWISNNCTENSFFNYFAYGEDPCIQISHYRISDSRKMSPIVGLDSIYIKYQNVSSTIAKSPYSVDIMYNIPNGTISGYLIKCKLFLRKKIAKLHALIIQNELIQNFYNFWRYVRNSVSEQEHMHAYAGTYQLPLAYVHGSKHCRCLLHVTSEN